MRGVGFLFFAAGALCVALGMGWGILMGITQDHSMAGAHAHLNLVGWVTLALFGVYYTLTPQAARSGLARVHLLVAVVGVATMVPGIALTIGGGTETLAIAGSLITFLSMLIFLFTVLRHGFGRA
jgi:hypothetical protein